MVLSDIHGLSAYLSGFFRSRIFIFLHFPGKVISDYCVVDTVILCCWIRLEYRNQGDSFSFCAEGIGIAEFIGLICYITLFCPVFEGIIFIKCGSVIINALEEGVVGWDGKAADVVHIVRFDADGILEVAFFVLTIDTDIARNDEFHITHDSLFKVGDDGTVLVVGCERIGFSHIFSILAIHPVVYDIVGSRFGSHCHLGFWCIPTFYMSNISQLSLFAVEVVIFRFDVDCSEFGF